MEHFQPFSTQIFVSQNTHHSRQISPCKRDYVKKVFQRCCYESICTNIDHSSFPQEIVPICPMRKLERHRLLRQLSRKIKCVTQTFTHELIYVYDFANRNWVCFCKLVLKIFCKTQTAIHQGNYTVRIGQSTSHYKPYPVRVADNKRCSYQRIESLPKR